MSKIKINEEEIRKQAAANTQRGLVTLQKVMKRCGLYDKKSQKTVAFNKVKNNTIELERTGS